MATGSWPDLQACVGTVNLRNILTELTGLKLSCVLDRPRVPASAMPRVIDTGLREAEVVGLTTIRDDAVTGLPAPGETRQTTVALSNAVGDLAVVYPQAIARSLELAVAADAAQRANREVGLSGPAYTGSVLAGWRTVTGNGDTKAAGSRLDRGAASTSATVYLHLAAVSGAASITFALWHSPDGSNWTQAPVTATLSAGSATSFSNTGTLGRYFALSWTFNSPTSPQATFLAAVV
jgi:hypothetical protein